jgi:tRNA dimethylallyltransferase
MYLRGLLRGIVEAPPRDPELRERLRRMADRFGSVRLHRWLRTIDPGSARRLPPRDAQRIVRALEISLAGGRSWSERLADRGTWAAGTERYVTLKYGLDMDRARLADRIERRVDDFFAAGLVEEVRALLREGVPPTANAFKAIGYREVLAAILNDDDPGGVRETVKRSTRRYSKRQRTWFRKEPGIEWLDAATPVGDLADAVGERWKHRLDDAHR